MMVSLTVVSRRIEDLDTFIERLEATRSFRGVLSRSDNALEDGTIESHLQGYYDQAAKPVAAASDPSAAPPAPRAAGDEPMTQTRGAFARRVLADYRAWIWPLGLLVAANLIVLVLAILPMSRVVRGAEVRARLASTEAADAAAELKAVTATRDGRDSATRELAVFYRDVLPADVSAATAPAAAAAGPARPRQPRRVRPQRRHARGHPRQRAGPAAGQRRAVRPLRRHPQVHLRPRDLRPISWSSTRWCWPKATSSRRRSI